jgi:hypothetical protein
VKKFRIFCILSIALTLAQILATIARIRKSHDDNDHAIGGSLMTSSIGLLIQIYIYVCIYSLYKRFEEERIPQHSATISIQPNPYIATYQPYPSAPAHYYYPSAPKY